MRPLLKGSAVLACARCGKHLLQVAMILRVHWRYLLLKAPIAQKQIGMTPQFWDIPTPWWQASTVLVGTGSALSLLIAVTAAAACCITYVIHAGTARIAGILQLISALLVIAGVAIYPIGWDNREVRESCGNSSHIYKLGTCQLSWSVYLLASAILLLLLCFCLSFCASRVNAGSFRI